MCSVDVLISATPYFKSGRKTGTGVQIDYLVQLPKCTYVIEIKRKRRKAIRARLDRTPALHTTTVRSASGRSILWKSLSRTLLRASCHTGNCGKSDRKAPKHCTEGQTCCAMSGESISARTAATVSRSFSVRRLRIWYRLSRDMP